MTFQGPLNFLKLEYPGWKRELSGPRPWSGARNNSIHNDWHVMSLETVLKSHGKSLSLDTNSVRIRKILPGTDTVTAKKATSHALTAWPGNSALLGSGPAGVDYVQNPTIWGESSPEKYKEWTGCSPSGLRTLPIRKAENLLFRALLVTQPQQLGLPKFFDHP